MTMEPIHVHIASADIELGAPKASQQQAGKRKPTRTVYRTYVLSGTVKALPILQASPRRRSAMIQALDNDIVIAETRATVERTENTDGQAAAVVVETPADPAAGATYSYTMPAAGRLRSLSWTFTSDAVAATRSQDLVIANSAGDTLWQQAASGSIAASQVSYVSLGETWGTLKEQGAGLSSSSLPDLQLQAGDTIQISIQNIDPGDQISAIVIGLELSTATPEPQGTLIPARNTAPWPVDDTGSVWAGVTTTASPSRVAVTAVYEED